MFDVRVLVASGSPLARAVLAAALAGDDGVESTESVESLAGLVARLGHQPPQVVLATPTLVDGQLYEALAEILRTGARVLVVCDASEAVEVSALLFAGASGCLLVQDSSAAEVVSAVRRVAMGQATLHPAVAASILAQWRASRSPVEPAVPRSAVVPATPAVELTARENDVLNALARGLPTKGIGRELGVSPKTVEAHIGRLLAKLGARNRAQALAVALDRGLLSAPAPDEASLAM
jgi:DNA-binding NarL/FixJ family response regulator